MSDTPEAEPEADEMRAYFLKHRPLDPDPAKANLKEIDELLDRAAKEREIAPRLNLD